MAHIFDNGIMEWMKTYVQCAKISSIRARSKEMKHFISIWGPLPLKKITKQMYQKRIIELSKKYSKNYLSDIHACGRMIFNLEINLGLIKLNPTENIQLPKYHAKVED